MQTTINTNSDLFYLPQSELFSEIEKAFYLEATKSENQKWLLSIISGEKDEAETLHRLAEAIRLDVVEQYEEEIDKLSNAAYQEVLHFAVTSTDCFKIAKEIYRQYRETQSKRIA